MKKIISAFLISAFSFSNISVFAQNKPPLTFIKAGRLIEAFGIAYKKGVKIAYGTDAGGFAWTENQAKEFAYRVKYGMPAMQAIQSATTVAAEMLEKSNDFGTIEAGKFADIIAVANDPLKDISELERVKFVMKNGEIYRNDKR